MNHKHMEKLNEQCCSNMQDDHRAPIRVIASDGTILYSYDFDWNSK